MTPVALMTGRSEGAKQLIEFGGDRVEQGIEGEGGRCGVVCAEGIARARQNGARGLHEKGVVQAARKRLQARRGHDLVHRRKLAQRGAALVGEGIDGDTAGLIERRVDRSRCAGVVSHFDHGDSYFSTGAWCEQPRLGSAGATTETSDAESLSSVIGKSMINDVPTIGYWAALLERYEKEMH